MPEPRTVVRKPNPRNVELDEKMASLEGKIKRWVTRDHAHVEARADHAPQATGRQEGVACNAETSARTAAPFLTK